MKEQSVSSQNVEQSVIEVPLIKARIINYPEITQLRNLKTNFYGKMYAACYFLKIRILQLSTMRFLCWPLGKLVSISGTVIRVSNTKLQCSWMAFKCCGCGTIQCVKQPDGAFTQPTRCLSTECHCRTFATLRSSRYTQTFDWQSVRIQELVPDDQVCKKSTGNQRIASYINILFFFTNRYREKVAEFLERSSAS